LLATKSSVRDYLRKKGQEESWIALQGEVYGQRILEAELFQYALEALKQLKALEIPVCIVSHKTKYPYRGKPVNLHEGALEWLKHMGFFENDRLGWKRNQVFFELTKQEKIQRIVTEKCTHFIDDLPEILDLLPKEIIGILFSPRNDTDIFGVPSVIRSWRHLHQFIGSHVAST